MDFYSFWGDFLVKSIEADALKFWVKDLIDVVSSGRGHTPFLLWWQVK